jgi:hypothetical protein
LRDTAIMNGPSGQFSVEYSKRKSERGKLKRSSLC